MNKNQLIIAFLAYVPLSAMGWGEPATATTSITANVVEWSENPCNFGDRYQEACDYAIENNLFPENNAQTTSDFVAMPFHFDPNAPEPQQSVTVEDYGTVRIGTGETIYE